MDQRLVLGSKGPEVEDAQISLNSRPPSLLAPLVPDGKYGPLTQARVKEFQRNNGLEPVGEVGPRTRALLYEPSASLVEEAQNVAKTWVTQAQAVLEPLQAFGTASSLAAATGTVPIPTSLSLRNAITALETHFHIDLLNTDTYKTNQWFHLLARIQLNFRGIMATLNKADIRNGEIFHSVGFVTSFADFGNELDNLSASQSPAYTMARDDFRFPKHGVFFTPTFHNFKTNARTAMVVHECTHFISKNHPDFAFEHPLFDGQVGDTGTQNYRNLSAEPASRNPSSYASFSQHIVFRADMRFGAGNNVM